ncbi:MAG: butanol dehydrogenase [Deltaproteobacteria bacterium RIFOXYD12_FULL_50_9]|nr:MAG: butanol dehydrogenase [Deltaproteobacteria bacterium RIFOXYD12_FULL_50_9]
MRDFVFHNPTKIIFGLGREAEIGSELAKAGVHKLLFVYGKLSIKQSGLYDRVIDSLKRANIEFIPFGGVSSNPILSHVRQGIALAKAERVDALLAVGGGSVIDESKTIAVGVLSNDDIWQYFIGKKVTAALPVYTILTLAATGSEMNGNAVVTNESTQQKFSIGSSFVYPRVSILNPALTCSVPPDYTAYAAVDAIAHVIEAYFTSESRPGLQNRLVESIIHTVIDTTENILNDPDNVEARGEFMWAATLALNGLTTSGVGQYGFPNHMLEHALSAIYNIPHGAGLAIIIPAWMRWYLKTNSNQFDHFAKIIFSESTGTAGINALEQWLSSIGAPIRLANAGIPVTDIPLIVDNAFSIASLWGVDAVYTRQTISAILHLAV